jgi:hypothetical protein
VRGGERQPDRAAAPEELPGVVGRAVVADGGQPPVRIQERGRAEGEIEGDHAAVRETDEFVQLHVRRAYPAPTPGPPAR